MAETSPLRPTPASVAVQEAFDRYYPELVAELTAVCGSAGAAEAAVDESFRRASALPDFAEIGRPLDWLRVTARNHVVRRPFRRDDLDGGAAMPTPASFERPSLERSLERARSEHRAGLLRRAGLAAAGSLLTVGALFAVTAASPWASAGAEPSAAPTSTRPRTSPPLIPTYDIPTPSTSTTAPEPWPPTAEQVVGHPAATKVYTVQSPQAADRRAIVWERCKPAEPNSYPNCDTDQVARAVEVLDGKGHRLLHLLGREQVVRPAFDGTFALVTSWGGEYTALVSPTMKEPKPFALRTGGRPRAGQAFSHCERGPCIVDLHGTVTMLDLPAEVEWDQNTTKGWVGTRNSEVVGPAGRIFLQQADGSFATVDVSIKVPTREGETVYATSWPDGRVAVLIATQSGFAQVAVSADRGRTWEVRWADPADAWSPTTFERMPLALKPGLVISPLRRWSPP